MRSRPMQIQHQMIDAAADPKPGTVGQAKGIWSTFHLIIPKRNIGDAAIIEIAAVGRADRPHSQSILVLAEIEAFPDQLVIHLRIAVIADQVAEMGLIAILRLFP